MKKEYRLFLQWLEETLEYNIQYENCSMDVLEDILEIVKLKLREITC